MQVKIGDTYRFKPTGFEGEASGRLPGQKLLPRDVIGKVIYIHPKRLYFTAEAMVNGQAIRESFSI